MPLDFKQYPTLCLPLTLPLTNLLTAAKPLNTSKGDLPK